MFIRRTTHTDKKNKKEYHTFKLIESVRTDRGPRQRMLFNLGADFSLPEERWKDLANRIEEIVTGQDALFAYPEDIETLAVRYARKVINKTPDRHGPKTYDKVIGKIGRLKERYKRVSHHYEMTVTKDENTNRATAITWEHKEQEKPVGVYCLRSNRVDFKEQELFNIFAMLTDIEDAFRSMKSERGMRPVYHQNENRSDGHLFITVLAYHVLHSIRVRLRSQGINDSWTTVRKGLSNHVRITTTMKRDDGKMIHIRKSSRPEMFHKRIYDALRLPQRPGKTVRAIL